MPSAVSAEHQARIAPHDSCRIVITHVSTFAVRSSSCACSRGRHRSNVVSVGELAEAQRNTCRQIGNAYFGSADLATPARVSRPWGPAKVRPRNTAWEGVSFRVTRIARPPRNSHNIDLVQQNRSAALTVETCTSEGLASTCTYLYGSPHGRPHPWDNAHTSRISSLLDPRHRRPRMSSLHGSVKGQLTSEQRLAATG